MPNTKLPYGKPAKLLVDCQGFRDGRIVLFEIWRKKGGKEEKVDEVYGVTKGGRGIGRWIPRIEGEAILPLQKKISEHVEEEKYYFIAKIDDQEVKSTDRVFTLPLDIFLKDMDGKPLHGAKCTITFSDGTKKEGVFWNGHAKFKGAPAGKFKIELDEEWGFVFEEV